MPRSRRWISLLLLTCFLCTPMAEVTAAGVWWMQRLTDSPSACQAEEPEPADSQVDLARRAWLKKFGDRWGLDEESSVIVVCGCTCCGDRCPMGAACCCEAPKYPVPSDASTWIRGVGCEQPSPHVAPSPVSTSWIYLLNRWDIQHSFSDGRVSCRYLDSCTDPIRSVETPPPEENLSGSFLEKKRS